MAQEQFIRIPYANEDEWLSLRTLGGSDAAAILGENPWRTNLEAYEYLIAKKEGIKSDYKINLYNQAAIDYGIKAEAPLRELFALDYPEYEVNHTKEVLQSIHYPFMTASLDGELLEKTTSKRGIYEGKTTAILNSMSKEKWGSVTERKVPQNYYIQCLHYLFVTGYDFAILHAQLKYTFDGYTETKRRIYRWDREEVIDDLKSLIRQEVNFWNNHVVPRIPPPRVITF
jgi:Phage-related protein, predicted endonuclease